MQTLCRISLGIGDNVGNCFSWRFLMDSIASSVPLITLPSFDRACSLVPSEYVQAWEWFLCEEQRGELWKNLPHRTKPESPQYPYRMAIDSELSPSRAIRSSFGLVAGASSIRARRPSRSRCIIPSAAPTPMSRHSILRTVHGCSSIRRKVLRPKAGATRITTKR